MGTYRDKNAVRVLGLAGFIRTHEVGQAVDIVDTHHVDVVVKAERLNEREVNLKSNVTSVFLIRGEDAECHAVRVAVGKTGKVISACSAVRLHDILKKGANGTGSGTKCNTHTFMTLADS